MGVAVVVGGNPLKETVWVELESQAKVELPLSKVKVEETTARVVLTGAGIFATGSGCAGGCRGGRRSSYPLVVPADGLVAFPLRWVFYPPCAGCRAYRR